MRGTDNRATRVLGIKARPLGVPPFMAKILLFRVARELSDRLVLQTDVKTLDCCGLLVQLKGNEDTAAVKVILLADGGALERSHALDLGADDVLRIPFDPVELFARIRAQLREKEPD